jgi:hypothetical protein
MNQSAIVDQRSSRCRTTPSTSGWRSRVAPDLMFNARAVRARAGVLNVIIGVTISLILTRPEIDASLYVSAVLLFDMIVAVVFGLTPLSPTGVLGTALTTGYDSVPTPHLPKRVAWSLGATMAATCLLLRLLHADEAWIAGVYGIFFVLTWLDAALGFCVGCWIYSKLFECEVCRIG